MEHDGRESKDLRPKESNKHSRIPITNDSQIFHPSWPDLHTKNPLSGGLRYVLSISSFYGYHSIWISSSSSAHFIEFSTRVIDEPSKGSGEILQPLRRVSCLSSHENLTDWLTDWLSDGGSLLDVRQSLIWWPIWRDSSSIGLRIETKQAVKQSIYPLRLAFKFIPIGWISHRKLQMNMLALWDGLLFISYLSYCFRYSSWPHEHDQIGLKILIFS